MFNRIRTASGLSEIHTWLRGKENAKQIMEESGREMTFRMLWNVLAIRIRHNDFSLETFRKDVKDLRVWLRIVDFFISKKTATSRIIFMHSNDKMASWKLGQIFITFLISITLETSKDRYGLADIYRFLRKIDNFEKWKKELEEKIYRGFSADSGARDLYEHKEMQEIIKRLSKPEYRTVLYFNKTLSFVKEEREILSDLSSIYIRAVNNKLLIDRPRKASGDALLKTTRNAVSKMYSHKGLMQVCECMKLEPYFMEWMNHAELLKIIAYSRTQHASLEEYIEQFGIKEGKSVIQRLDQKYTLSLILSKVWKDSKPFGLDWILFTKPRVKQTGKWIEKNRFRFYQLIS